MNAIGDLAILTAALFMAATFWATSRKMGRAHEGTRLISVGLYIIAASAALDALELLGPDALIPGLGTDLTEGLAYLGYSAGAVILVFGFTRWLPLLKRLDAEVAGRARAEAELNRSLDRERRFNAGLEALGKDHIQKGWTQSELIKQAARRLSDLMGVARVSVWTRAPAGGAIECIALFDSRNSAFESGMRIDRSASPAYFDAIESGATVKVEDALNDPITQAFGPGYLEPLNIGALLDAPIRDGDGVRGVLCCEHAGGGRVWTPEDVSLATSVAQYIAVTFLTEELKGALDAAESASAAKTAFLANMSHELRTPLNGMLGMAELMAEDAANPAQAEAAATLIGSGQQLLAVLNDVLDLSRIEAGRLEIRPEPTDIAALIRESCALFRPAARKKGLAFEIDIQPLPDALAADPVRVRQVLFNLIANAVKFTETGAITIAARMNWAPGGADRIAISVTDTGCGISEEGQVRLFRRFSQADEADARRHGGAGLGLVIARELAQRMDGDILLESRLGEGSCFTFSFAARQAETPDSNEAATATANALSGARVLLVDDNEVNRMVARCFIEPAGAEVVEAESGAEALAAFQEQSFDLVLLDAHMPHMDGVETLSRLRALPGGEETPAIAITADALARDEARYLAAGMDAYVPKPVDKARLIDTCTKILHEGRAAPSADAATA
jgi:signal transduction histidine kinase/CheY-like chemotaxis protein